MIDELDLAFDEHAERGRPRHRRGSRGGKKSGGKSAVAFLMAFILLALLGGGAFLGYKKIKGFFTAADYDGAGTGAVTVEIAQGSSITEMGNTLVTSDVVKSTKAFIDAAEKNPKGKNIQSGTYNLRKQMSAKAAVALMLDPKARIVNGVTITEGMTTVQIYAKLSAATKIPVKDYQDAAKDPEALGVPATWFKRTDKLPVRKSIEGFLFPDTYEFPPKNTAADNLKLMVNHFLTVADQINFEDTVTADRHVSPYEGLIVASLAQAEAGIPGDLGGVARVAYNRAYKAHMPLQFDTTANYWLELNGKAAKHSGKLTPAELNDPKNPYNTVSKQGLPPGPIDNPGKLAMDAAANTPAGPWLYFVAIDKSGKSAFAVTLAEQNKNIQQACRNGIPLC
jgi:UPF0755 protein